MGPNEPSAPQATQPASVPAAQPQTVPQFQPTTVPGGPVPSPAPQKSKKGLLVGLVAASAAVVLVIVGVILWLTVFSISAADYKKAQETLAAVDQSYKQVGDDFRKYLASSMTGLDGSGSLSDDKTTLDKSIAELKSKMTDLKGLKALNDGEIKKKYEDFLANEQKAIAVVDDYIATHETLKSAGTTCNTSKSFDFSDKTKLVAVYDDLLGSCMKDLQGLSQSKQSDLAAYGKRMYELYQEQRSIIQDVQNAHIANDEAKYDVAVDKLASQSKKFIGEIENAKKLVETVKTRASAASDSLKELINTVDKKVK